ncbi:Hypothetical predicted protein [Marmota monax]|uniref:Rho-GAP domain-containing protein n=1 Tax=Marmota monax TaxID=9995 RepID=A0A5E4BM32_MARMO|nr:Hypothetical predicted protein [Marmota monax]
MNFSSSSWQKDFEDFRKKWQRTDHELGKYKDLLMKAETECSALDVQLKRARNQVDVVIKRRQQAEADCEKLERQIQLIREMLMCDTSGSIQLSEEQKPALAFLNRGQPSSEKTRCIGSTVDQGNESIVAKTTVTDPNDGGPIEAVSTIETVPHLTRSRRKTGTLQPWNSDSTLSSRPLEPRTENESSGTPVKIGEGMLADFVSQTSPMIPPIVVHCVNEIELRGLTETGLHRVSGCDRTVKELKEKFLRVKTVPLLSKVDDIHAICSLLKDFLQNLKEPLLTFRLNKAFMEAAEITDEDNSIAAMYQAVESPNTKMDVSNMAKVFGPTIVAHAVPNPDPVTMLQDIKRQPKVVERLLSLPLEYWSQFMMVEQENIDPLHVIENSNAFSIPQTPDIKVSLLGPVTTPEHQLLKTPSSSSLSQRVHSTTSPRTLPDLGAKASLPPT